MSCLRKSREENIRLFKRKTDDLHTLEEAIQGLRHAQSVREVKVYQQLINELMKEKILINSRKITKSKAVGKDDARSQEDYVAILFRMFNKVNSVKFVCASVILGFLCAWLRDWRQALLVVLFMIINLAVWFLARKTTTKPGPSQVPVERG